MAADISSCDTMAVTLSLSIDSLLTMLTSTLLAVEPWLLTHTSLIGGSVLAADITSCDTMAVTLSLSIDLLLTVDIKIAGYDTMGVDTK